MEHQCSGRADLETGGLEESFNNDNSIFEDDDCVAVVDSSKVSLLLYSGFLSGDGFIKRLKKIENLMLYKINPSL